MKALFAGSFDPFTVGHSDIVERALQLFDSLVIGIGFNEHKPGEWTVSQRLTAIKSLYASNPRIRVEAYSGLTSVFAKEVGADVLLRGIRTVQDFEYERNLADINREVFNIDTTFLVSNPKLAFISSSMVRELLHNGFDASHYIAGDFPLPKGISIKQ